MKKIEKLDLSDYAIPSILTESTGKSHSLTKVIDGMLDKLDELVLRVNELSMMVAPDPIGKEAPRSPRPRYLPHDKEN